MSFLLLFRLKSPSLDLNLTFYSFFFYRIVINRVFLPQKPNKAAKLTMNFVVHVILLTFRFKSPSP